METITGELSGWFDSLLPVILQAIRESEHGLPLLYQLEQIVNRHKTEYQETLSSTIQEYYIKHSETVEASVNHQLAVKTLDNIILYSAKDDQFNLDDWLNEYSAAELIKEEVKRKLRYTKNVQSTLNRYLPNYLKVNMTPTQFTRMELLEYEIDQAITEYMSSNIFVASENTLQRVTQEIYDIIREAYADEGKGIDQVTQTIIENYNQLRDYEAERIARTETLKAQGNATHQRLVNNPDVEYIQWIATDDDRTRDSHLELNGEITYADGTGVYSNGLAHPGDENGDIEEWINCRCDEAAFIPEAGYVPPEGATSWFEDDMVLDPTISVPDVTVELPEYLASWW